MNEQLKDKALSDLLNLTTKNLSDSIELGKQQIPDVLHQMLVWNATTAILCQILGIFGVWAYFKLVPKYLHIYIKDEVAEYVVPLFILLTSILLIACNFAWIEILLAPKYYLLQQAASLVKGG